MDQCSLRRIADLPRSFQYAACAAFETETENFALICFDLNTAPYKSCVK